MGFIKGLHQGTGGLSGPRSKWCCNCSKKRCVVVNGCGQFDQVFLLPEAVSMGFSIITEKSNKLKNKLQKCTNIWCMKGVRSPTTGQQRRWSRSEIVGLSKERQGGWKGVYVKHYINMRGTLVSMLCRELCSTYFEHSQLKKISGSNLRPVHSGGVLNYSASRGLPSRTTSSKSGDARNTAETKWYPLQKTVNTIFKSQTLVYTSDQHRICEKQKITYFSH